MSQLYSAVLNKSSSPLGLTSLRRVIDFMRFPGEVRNCIYDFIICGLPLTSALTTLPAIAYASMRIHQEFMSQYLPQIHLDVTSMQDVWRFHALLDCHPINRGWDRITKVVITSFTRIAHTQTRANEIMDFLSHCKSLQYLSLDITLDDLHHGFQGRIKDIHHFSTEFELFRILTFHSLQSLVISVKRGYMSYTPESMVLIGDMVEFFKAGVGGELRCMLSE